MSTPARPLSVAGSRLSMCVLAAFAIALLVPDATACPVCFGAPGDPLVKGATNGVWVLLGFVAFVQIGFVAMFWSFWRRAKALKKFRDELRVIDGGGGQTILSGPTPGQTIVCPPL